MCTSKLLLLSSGIFVLSALAPAQVSDSLVHSYVTSENFNGVGGMIQNTSPNEIQMTLSGSEWYEQTVAGSSDGAPWSASFTPINSVFHLRSFSATRTVPPCYWLVIDTKYIVESGSEKWMKTVITGEGQQPIVSWPTRTRLWYIPNGETVAVMP